MLIDALKPEGGVGAHWRGIGAIQHELLGAGAAHVTSIDPSDAYIQSAQAKSVEASRAVSPTTTATSSSWLKRSLPPTS
jgi:hypothetical protein